MELSVLIRALGEPMRLSIFLRLLERKHCVRSLSKKLGITESAVSQHMKVLREAARLEGCYEGAEAAFDSLEARLRPDLEGELLRQRDLIRPYVEDEIVSRYYYQRGRTQHLLRNDKVFDQAVELLRDEERYRKILKP